MGLTMTAVSGTPVLERRCYPRTVVVRWVLAVMVILGLVGCGGGPIPVHLETDETPGPITSPTDEVRDILDEAFGFWGRAYELVEHEPKPGKHSGFVSIFISEKARSGGLSWSTDEDHCELMVWSRYKPIVLAHELGHAWGLHHDDRDDNLMRAGGPTKGNEPEVDDEQWEHAQERIDEFMRCPRDDKRRR